MPTHVNYVYCWVPTPLAGVPSAVFFSRKRDAEEYHARVGYGDVLRVYMTKAVDRAGEPILTYTPASSVLKKGDN